MSSSPAEEQLLDEEITTRAVSGANGAENEGSSEDEDAVQTGSRRKKGPEAPLDEEEDVDDLFGDEEDGDVAETTEPPKRQLDDEELDSGDDEGRLDRLAEDDGEQFEDRTVLAMDMEIPRQAVPEPSDGEMYLLKIPPFLSLEPQAWQTTTFQPPTTDHHSRKAASSTFSAFNTALTTIRWRHSPSNPVELQSNARINRWADGSLTMQLASDPTTQYEIDGNSLAPPQRNPIKPTPTSISNTGIKAGKQIASQLGQDEKYDPYKDAFTYLVMPVEGADALRVAHKITAGLSLRQSDSSQDDAIERLQAALAIAANATKVGGATGQLEATEFDPELQRKEAEDAERQMMRERKKRENAQERERLRADRTLGRAGVSSARYGGLNVGMLEDDEMDGEGGRSQTSKMRAKPRRRRNSEYSDDEDFGRKKFTKEDSYDEEDDFVAASDEEEVVEDDDDPDDGIVESPRDHSSKRDRPRPGVSAETGDEADADAEGELDDDVPQARTKRRRVVDEDDEDE